MEWEAPQDLKGFQVNFLGFHQLLSPLLHKGYAELASPLTYLTKKRCSLGMGGPLNDRLFQKLKEAFM